MTTYLQGPSGGTARALRLPNVHPQNSSMPQVVCSPPVLDVCLLAWQNNFLNYVSECLCVSVFPVLITVA